MDLLEKTIDKSTPIPLYYQIKKMILEEIDNGSYPPGSLLPTETEICDVFGISRTTVRQAINDLAKEGRVYRVKSKGTFVSKPKISHDFINKLESYNDQILRMGMIPSTHVIEMSRILADKIVSDALEIPEGSPVIRILRQRFADNEPFVLVETSLPYESCHFVLDHDLNHETLYSILAKSSLTEVRFSKRELEAVGASDDDVKFLNMKRGKPILRSSSIGYNVENKPIEYSIAHYVGEKISLTTTVSV